VPGLRREEVAAAASISTDYYTRLEQGRLPASAPVLDDLARVLQLTPDERAYMAGLAGKVLPVSAAVTATQNSVTAPVRRMLDDLRITPAFVMGPRTEIIGWNTLGAELITDFGSIPEHERYFIRLLFLDPAMRELYVDWLSVVDLAIAQLRMDSARDPEDPQLQALVRELSAADTAFEGLWTSHEVAGRDSGWKTLRHPRVGELTLQWAALTTSTGQTIVVWTADPGTVSYERLGRLAASVQLE
jgi:transcriptional regulator with XRE-family HTH domain